MKTTQVLALVVALIVSGCSLAQAPSPQPTIGPRPTLAPAVTLPPGATPLPTPADCAAEPVPPAGETVIQLDDFPIAGANEVVDVTWTGSRYVAVGFGALPGEGFDGPRQGFVWTSCDGLTWQQLVDPNFLYVSPTSVGALGVDIYVLGELSLCGPVYECPNVAEAGNVVLRSAAGGPWQRLTQDPQIQTAYDLDMKAIGNRLAVWGTADDENASQTLWLSNDGEIWQATSDLAGMDPIDAVAAWDMGVLALGSVYPEDAEEPALVAATSPDGQQFTPVPAPNPPGAIVLDIAQGPARYVAVGGGYPEDDDFGFVGLALHSADGTSWTEASASDGSFASSQLDNVHALANGFAAVGYTFAADDFATQQGTIWVSADGTAWSRLTEFGGTGSVYTTSAASPAGMVIFSADEDLTGEEVTGTASAYFVPAALLTP